MPEITTLDVPARFLEAAGVALCGEHWQSPLARLLRIQLRTAQRWAEAARADQPYRVSVSLLEEIMGKLEGRLRPIQNAHDQLKHFYDSQA